MPIHGRARRPGAGRRRSARAFRGFCWGGVGGIGLDGGILDVALGLYWI